MKRFLIVVLFLFYSQLISIEYQVEENKKNLVKFISNAPVEDFEGITSKIDGYINLKDQSNLYDAEMYFEVDLNSVDTDNGLRNRHMREEYLHTDKYPITSFKGNIHEVNKISDLEYNVKASGDFNLHGITRKMTVEGKVILGKDKLELKSNFTLKLTDFNIEVPKLMFVKISNEIKLVLDFFVKTNR